MLSKWNSVYKAHCAVALTGPQTEASRASMAVLDLRALGPKDGGKISAGMGYGP